jgi:hypothetical protein
MKFKTIDLEFLEFSDIRETEAENVAVRLTRKWGEGCNELRRRDLVEKSSILADADGFLAVTTFQVPPFSPP